ncbi:hypothetical protein MPC4_100080 [Methylocella tundrae]|uniref:Uncharacterized protein n=1 Tax=Methylocella tundrae TaxID=227605 RepID=A0A8B6M0S2_METTU|nr:hypothetical protein [Methylocella tundrae]VTZ25917.1 hypothetical protein MPC1_2720002 [Methylocella tundrae]VTZ48637.1 hypothetical protein MPC4_100080 [Methylocella tundrae]
MSEAAGSAPYGAWISRQFIKAEHVVHLATAVRLAFSSGPALTSAAISISDAALAAPNP